MHSNGIGFCLAVVVFLATCLPGVNKNDEKKTIKPLVSWTGPQSQVHNRSFIRVDKQEQWDQVWLEHLGKSKDQAFVDSDTQFQIDFDRTEIIAIFQGSGWNSRGIRLNEINETAEEITIRYEDISYQTSGIDGGGEQVAVFSFMVFPKTTKSFRLHENTQGLKDQPSKWTERAVLKTSQD